MFATIARMMRWLVTLTDEDLEIAEQACRSLAATYRRDAERQSNPGLKQYAVDSAEKFERMAERMRRARQIG
jgi:hypothetical protein